jgi:hypothetical protein
MQLIYDIIGEKAIGRMHFLFGSYEHTSGSLPGFQNKVFL